MPLVRACAVQDFDVATGTCAHEVWMDSPGVLPPLPASDGLLLSGYMIGVCSLAWSFKFLRRFLSPKTG